MGNYKIKISYRTGNSFGTTDEEGYLDYEWDNLNMAKRSLRRIKNHNEYCDEYDMFIEPKEPIEGVVWDERYKYVHLELITDDGKPYRCSAFWVGYFERLYCAEIECNNNDMVYRPGDL